MSFSIGGHHTIGVSGDKGYRGTPYSIRAAEVSSRRSRRGAYAPRSDAAAMDANAYQSPERERRVAVHPALALGALKDASDTLFAYRGAPGMGHPSMAQRELRPPEHA